MASMQVLVTGGAGFIGSHLVDKLIDHNCYVTVLDDLSNGKRYNLSESHHNGQLELVEGTILDRAVVAKAVEDADAIGFFNGSSLSSLATIFLRASLISSPGNSVTA